MDLFDTLKQMVGTPASIAHVITDTSTGLVFPVNLPKEVFRLPLQKLGVAGKQPNTIPSATPSKTDSPREVRLGSHPVGGIIAKLVGAMAAPSVQLNGLQPSPNPAPDPTHHWAVMVGDYYHELGGDIDFHVLYNNDKISEQTFMGAWQSPMVIGTTTFNDEAIRLAAEDVINAMEPIYNVYNNNCQLFCMNLADAICQGGHEKPVTSWQMIPQLHSEPAKRAQEVLTTHTPVIQM